MSLSALSLVALPAATGLAHHVVQAGEQVGTGFLSLLSQVASRSAVQNESPAMPSTSEAAESETTNGSASLSAKTNSWCEKLLSWLGDTQSTEDVEIQLSLDSLDQPHIAVSGPQAESINAAIARDPTWLQEFRELALDRLAEQGQAAAGAPFAPSPTLTLTQHGGQRQAKWTP